MDMLGVLLVMIAADDSWHEMPNGKLMHSSCIHHFDQTFTVLASGAVRLANGTTLLNFALPCPHAPRNNHATPTAAAAPTPSPLGYYSDWVA